MPDGRVCFYCLSGALKEEPVDDIAQLINRLSMVDLGP